MGKTMAEKLKERDETRAAKLEATKAGQLEQFEAEQILKKQAATKLSRTERAAKFVFEANQSYNETRREKRAHERVEANPREYSMDNENIPMQYIEPDEDINSLVDKMDDINLDAMNYEVRVFYCDNN